jgi:hypothetical protein
MVPFKPSFDLISLSKNHHDSQPGGLYSFSSHAKSPSRKKKETMGSFWEGFNYPKVILSPPPASKAKSELSALTNHKK